MKTMKTLTVLGIAIVLATAMGCKDKQAESDQKPGDGRTLYSPAEKDTPKDAADTAKDATGKAMDSHKKDMDQLEGKLKGTEEKLERAMDKLQDAKSKLDSQKKANNELQKQIDKLKDKDTTAKPLPDKDKGDL